MITFEIIFIIGFAILLHYTYEWSAKNRLIGYFSMANRSAWEQLKTIAVPMFVMILLDYSSFGHLNNYWFAKFVSMILALLLAWAVIYLCKTFFKKTTLLYDAAAAALSAVYSLILFNNILEMKALNLEILGIVGVGILFVAFALLTQFPLKIGLFEDPSTKKYGFGLTKENLSKRFHKTKIKKIKKEIIKK